MKEDEYFAYRVIEYMTGEWNSLKPRVEKKVTTILKIRYNKGMCTRGQFRFIEQAFGMPNPEVTDFKDETDLANAIEICKEETKLKYWDI